MSSTMERRRDGRGSRRRWCLLVGLLCVVSTVPGSATPSFDPLLRDPGVASQRSVAEEEMLRRLYAAVVAGGPRPAEGRRVERGLGAPDPLALLDRESLRAGSLESSQAPAEAATGGTEATAPALPGERSMVRRASRDALYDLGGLRGRLRALLDEASRALNGEDDPVAGPRAESWRADPLGMTVAPSVNDVVGELLRPPAAATSLGRGAPAGQEGSIEAGTAVAFGVRGSSVGRFGALVADETARESEPPLSIRDPAYAARFEARDQTLVFESDDPLASLLTVARQIATAVLTSPWLYVALMVLGLAKLVSSVRRGPSA